LTTREIASYGSNQLLTATNIMHVPEGTELSDSDHILHTHKWGELLDSPIGYDVAGSMSQSALEQTYPLKLTTNVKE
jgi:hypothetical protein